MKRSLRKLIVFASMLVLMMAMSTGVAYADHGGNSPHFEDTTAETATAPVGSHLLAPGAPGSPGAENGFDNPNSGAFDAIAKNPNCPLHYPSP